MEPWLIITLIIAGVVVLGILAWLTVAVIGVRTFKETTKDMDRFHDRFFN